MSSDTPNAPKSTFLYFAYGSNLLTQRIHENNPSAVRYGTAKLPNYRLDFNLHSPRWHGASATIAPTLDAHVWGALWELDIADMKHLDKQECGGNEMYFSLDVNVEMVKDGALKRCRTYQHVAETPRVEDMRKLPKERQPSGVYMKVIREGAKESGLPKEWLEWLANVPDNGYNGKVAVQVDFEFDRVEEKTTEL